MPSLVGSEMCIRDRRMGRELKGLLGSPQDVHHLVVHDLDNLLRRGDAFYDALAHGPLSYVVDEILDNLVVDIRLEQHHADLPHRGIYIFLGQFALAPQLREYALEPVTKAIEHELPLETSV